MTHLEAFRSGMIYAAHLRGRFGANEWDGVDALKQSIRRTAHRLTRIPDDFSVAAAASGSSPRNCPAQVATSETGGGKFLRKNKTKS
jgi:hypothetical protein